MYLPAHFEQTDPVLLAELIAAAPLGMLASVDEAGEPHVDHVPFELDSVPGSAGPSHILRAHVARANPVWRHAGGRTVRIVFTGPDAYISPSWYASKFEHGRVVPTWNYVLVHAVGRLRSFDDPDRLRALVRRLTDRFEADRASPWSIDDAPGDYVERMLTAIVGIEIELEQLFGKFKLGQNRSAADRASLQAGLDAADATSALAQLTRRVR